MLIRETARRMAYKPLNELPDALMDVWAMHKLRSRARSLSLYGRNDESFAVNFYAEKILSELEYREGGGEYADDDPDVPWPFFNAKRLGIFVGVYRRAKLPVPGIDRPSVEQGENFMELHMRRTSVNPKLEDVIPSLQLVADYIGINQLNPVAVVGITHERLAKPARRYGFSIKEDALPPAIETLIAEYMRLSFGRKLNGHGVGKICIVYQPITEFLKRFPQRNLDDF